jgi:hypothetical protein
MRSTRPFRLALGFALVVPWLAFAGCDDDDCDDGTCVCASGSSCEFECDEPPCHVDCKGNNDSCKGACGNGDCTCGKGSDCDFSCVQSPCHVDCNGDSCSGTCANGDCSCARGGSCDFRCSKGPCHVDCAGDNPNCDGTCSNGTCHCGPDSHCNFTCADHNCHVECEAGSTCTLSCPDGEPGTQGCLIDTCAAGEPVVCADGTIACGVACAT